METVEPDVERHETFRSRTIAALLAMLGGTVGAHHYYLNRRLWWLYPVIAMPLLGLALRADEWYRQWSFYLASLVTLVSLGEAIRIALIGDEAWDARFNPGSAVRSRSGVLVVLIAILALILAALLGMSVLALVSESIFRILHARG